MSAQKKKNNRVVMKIARNLRIYTKIASTFIKM